MIEIEKHKLNKLIGIDAVVKGQCINNIPTTVVAKIIKLKYCAKAK